MTAHTVRKLRHASPEIVEVKDTIPPHRRKEKVRLSPSRDFIPGVSCSVEGSASGRVGQRFPPTPPNFNVESDFKKKFIRRPHDLNNIVDGGVRGGMYTNTNLNKYVLLQLFHP